MDTQRFKSLLEKHIQGNLSADEKEEFYQCLYTIDDDSLQAVFDSQDNLPFEPTLDYESLFQKVAAEVNLDRIDSPPSPKPKLVYYTYALAAGIAASLLLVFYFLMFNDQESKKMMARGTDVKMSSVDAAMMESSIRFADGKTLQIEDMSSDTLQYHGLSLVKTNENELSILKNSRSANRDEIPCDFRAKIGNTLTLILPDQSVVVLNSGSSINLSSAYGQRDRNLVLKGEGFFDVTHNPDLPFIVQVKDAKINVLGTVFNISGYAEDKAVETTLISGSVKVIRNSDEIVIKPLQQAVIVPNSKITVKNNVEVDDVLAWKNGFFRFHDESITHVLSELSKWYPITKIDIKEGSQDRFTGSIKRTKKLTDVLSAISEVSDLKFEIEEGRVTVMK